MDNALQVHVQEYAGNFPYFRQPVKVGEFSLDKQRKVQHDNSEQKFIIWPSKKALYDGQSIDVNFDLNISIDKAIRKDEEHVNERLDSILQWIQMNQAKFKLSSCQGELESLSTDFVCYRGLMTKLMSTPYESREPWIICASRWRGTIYLCAFDTEQKQAERRRETDRQRAMASWGFKFEQFMMADTPDGQPEPALPCVETAEFCCVLRTRLGRHSLVFGAEVDGVDAQHTADSPPMARFIELKTSRHVETQRQMNTLRRFKMLKWWAQSFLVGIERVVVGYRDDHGVVRHLRAYATNELPRGQDFWSPAVCMNFANAFLDYVARHVTGDDPRAVWRFDFRPDEGRVTCRPLGDSERYRLLPDWYLASMFGSGTAPASSPVC